MAGTKGPEGNTFLIGTPSCGRGDRREWYTSGFAAPNRAAVDVAHANAIELGGNCEGPRGPKEMNYYAAYFRDPDGNKIMVARQGPD